MGTSHHHNTNMQAHLESLQSQGRSWDAFREKVWPYF